MEPTDQFRASRWRSIRHEEFHLDPAESPEHRHHLAVAATFAALRAFAAAWQPPTRMALRMTPVELPDRLRPVRGCRKVDRRRTEGGGDRKFSATSLEIDWI